jgi:pimeloyl-ACP methyl ester carboxylesterase
MSTNLVIAAAHPTDIFDAGTASLLLEAAQAPAVCINPHARPASLETMVDEIEAERRRRGHAPWVFWGMSGGGWLGQLYARRHPDALAGLILESTCACFRARLADPACVLSPFNEAWRGPLEARGLRVEGSHDEAGDPQATEWLELEGVGSVFRRAGGAALLVAPMPIGPEMRRAMPALWSFDARAWLREIRVPTLVMCGSADPVVPTSHARALHAAIAGAQWTAIDGAGHVPVVQRRPEAGAAVRGFLARRRLP